MREQIIDKAPCGYFAFTDDNLLVHVNDTLCALLHYQKEELPGKNVETLFTIATRIFFQTHLFPLVKMHNHAEEIFLTLLARNGDHMPVLLNARRTDWQQQTITSCAFIVVPNRKKFEDELVAARNAAQAALQQNTELQQARKELQQHAARLEQQMHLVHQQNYGLQQFSHAVTHNLKEPLRKILVYSDKLQRASSSAEAEKVSKAGHQLLGVITALQEYVWLNEKANVFTRLDLNALLHHAAQKVRMALGHHLELECQELPLITGDREQLELMLFHVLSNAVRFRRQEQAMVTIHCTLLKQNRFTLLEDRYSFEDFVRLEITDQGQGFDPLYRSHIFELFRKLHSGPGQGLGLALCKRVAENHGGSIEADSIPATSTTITIKLPLRQLATIELRPAGK